MNRKRRLQRQRWQGALLLSLMISGGSSSAVAIQLANGTVSFAQAPQLIEAKTFEKSVGSLIATYYFTLTVPNNAGEALQRVILQQSQGASLIKFNLEATRAYLEQPGRPPIGVKAEPVATDPKAIVLTFEPPIAPGQTVTFRVSPVMNPTVAGVYLFSLTAFPQGERPNGQLLELARLQFYNSGGRGGSL